VTSSVPVVVELAPGSLERLADLVAARLRAPASIDTPGELVTADELARYLGVSRAFVYQHADDLGAQRLGTGPRARLRFSPTVARQVVARKSEPTTTAAPPRRRARADRRPPGSVLRSRPPTRRSGS